MRELLILALIAAVGYLAYDDYYKQRPALEQAQQQIQQLQQNPAAATVRTPRYVPTGHPAPAWFQKHLDEGSALEQSQRHQRKDEVPGTPRP